jgi:hypothetical protein
VYVSSNRTVIVCSIRRQPHHVVVGSEVHLWAEASMTFFMQDSEVAEASTGSPRPSHICIRPLPSSHINPDFLAIVRATISLESKNNNACLGILHLHRIFSTRDIRIHGQTCYWITFTVHGLFLVYGKYIVCDNTNIFTINNLLDQKYIYYYIISDYSTSVGFNGSVPREVNTRFVCLQHPLN